MRQAALACLTATLGAASCSPSPGAPIAPPDDAPDHVRELDGVCKTAQGLNPVVELGQGQSDYLPLSDLETVRVEAGPQGGHHIWVAVQMKNLLRSGSRTIVRGIAPATGTTITPYEVIFTFDPSEGGYCKLFGLRFQLDLDGVDYVALLGHELDVTATIVDRDGDSAEDTKRVTLSDSIEP